MQEYPMFHTSDGRKVIENLDEFDDAREVVAGLAAEYQACERPDYVSALRLMNMRLCMHINENCYAPRLLQTWHSYVALG